jgi:chitin synthase
MSYVVTIKCGNDNEINTSKRGNRGKKDSALIIYETIEYLHNEYYNEKFHISYTHIINYIQHTLTIKDDEINNYNYMLILDCDTEIEKDGLLVLLNYMKNNNNCITVCGQTVVKNVYDSFITIIQSFEYFISHLLLKTFESVMYNTFVLSGCFTLIKLKNNNNETLINKNIIKKYTEIEGDNSLYEKNLLDIGEDRYLTSLIIKEYPNNDITYISDALCFTNVPTTFKVLLDQRRRWTNSLISCLFLLFLQPPQQSFYKHIKMYLIIIMELFIIFILPLVIIIGILTSILNITLQGYSFIPLLITVVIIFLNLIIIILVCKFDMILKFVPFFISLPVFSILIPWYSIMNLDNLKWGLTRDTTETNDLIIVNENISTPRNNEISYIQINI